MKRESQIVERGDRTVEIRPAHANDMDGLLAIEQQCFNVPYYDFYTLDRRDFEFYLEDPESLFLVATSGSKLVGYILGPVETWHEPPAAHIDSIAVLPDSQHRGIGSRLLESFIELIRRQNCKIVTLEVSPVNAAGMAFFAKYGIHKVHRLRNYYGKGLHGLLLAAPLDPQP